VWLDERPEPSAAVLSDATTTSLLSMSKPKLAPIASCETLTDSYDVTAAVSSVESSLRDDSAASPALITVISSANDQQHLSTTTNNSRRLQLPTTLDSLCVSSTAELSTAASSDTLVPGSPACTLSATSLPSSAATLTATTPTPSSSGLKRSLAALLLVNFRGGGDSGRKSRGGSTSHQLNALALSPATSPKFSHSPLCAPCRQTSPPSSCDATLSDAASTRRATSPSPLQRSPVCSPKLQRASSPISYSYSSPNIITNLAKSRASSMSLISLSHSIS